MKKKIDKPILTVEDSVKILDCVFSKEDPIWIDKIEMTPSSIEEVLSEKFHGEISDYDSKLLKIEFYRLKDDCYRKSRGTLFSMVLDRMGEW